VSISGNTHQGKQQCVGKGSRGLRTRLQRGGKEIKKCQGSKVTLPIKRKNLWLGWEEKPRMGRELLERHGKKRRGGVTR